MYRYSRLFQVRHILRLRFGVEVSFVDEVVDLKTIAQIAYSHNSKLIVDNTICQPLLLGADIVVYSATKYLCGRRYYRFKQRKLHLFYSIEKIMTLFI